MSNFDKLVAYFERFPGIGGRQARRFAFHLLRLPPADIEEFAKLVTTLQGSVVECTSCHRYFSRNGGPMSECAICSDTNRDHSKLLVVERDTDIQSIERAGSYDGKYFVLGGTVPLLNNEGTAKLRGGALRARLEIDNNITELILGFSINPDGENTARYVEKLTKETDEAGRIAITHLGRGLSTGSELEYADPDTIKNALSNRAKSV